MAKAVRLDKFLADAGKGTRSEVKKFIQKGQVQVNGVPAKKPEMKVDLENDVVVLSGETVGAAPEFVYYLLNKPAGCVSATEDRNDRTVMEYVPSDRKGLFPVGRLDKDSTGLILLTNDGELTDRILRGKNNHEKEYLVTVQKPLRPEIVRAMEQGVPILDTMTRPCQIIQIDSHTFRIILTQGLNRQIRRMCEYFGYKVVTLKRVRIMNLYINGLEEGKYREIRPEERKELEEMLSSEKSEKRTGGSHERIIHKKNEGAGRKAPGSVQGLLSGRQGDHVQRGVRRPVRHSERTGERNRDRSGRQSNR